MLNPEEKLMGIFDTIFSKVQKRALSQDEQERLRQELSTLAKAVRALAAEGVAAKLKELQVNTIAGFDLVAGDVDQLTERVKRMEELVVALADDGK